MQKHALKLFKAIQQEKTVDKQKLQKLMKDNMKQFNMKFYGQQEPSICQQLPLNQHGMVYLPFTQDDIIKQRPITMHRRRWVAQFFEQLIRKKMLNKIPQNWEQKLQKQINPTSIFDKVIFPQSEQQQQQQQIESQGQYGFPAKKKFIKKKEKQTKKNKQVESQQNQKMDIEPIFEQQIEIKPTLQEKNIKIEDIKQIYVESIKTKIQFAPFEWKTDAIKVRPSSIFTQPIKQSTNQQIEFFQKQIQLFMSKKNKPNKFIWRRNIYQKGFAFNQTIDNNYGFQRLNNKDNKLLNDIFNKKYALPVQYFYHQAVGGGFIAKRAIRAYQVVGFFNGPVIKSNLGQQIQNKQQVNNMLDYISPSEEITYSITTCGQFWGMGPMFNTSIPKTCTLGCAGAITDHGIQYILYAKRNIKKGEHLTWDYNSGGYKFNKNFQIKDINKVIKQYQAKNCQK